MQTLSTTSLQVRDNQLWILDQQALPQKKSGVRRQMLRNWSVTLKRYAYAVRH